MSIHRFALSAFVLLGAAGLSGCRDSTDLGRECFMVKKDPTGAQSSVRIKESEIGAGRDFISFGAAECDDFVCVRDANFQPKDIPAGADLSTIDAKGYCSRGCEAPSGDTTSINDQCPAANPEDDKIPALKLNCRALLLDTETLNLICREDPAQCQRIFGDTRTPYFCARGDDRQL